MKKENEETLEVINRLFEMLHQADADGHKSVKINIYEAGSQHVDKVENQYFYENTSWTGLPKRKEKETKEVENTFNAETPLSALFRECHHEELRKVIDSWKPYLNDESTNMDALDIWSFQFDKDRIYSNRVYQDLCDLEKLGALCVPLSHLARYLAAHSNLSRSYATLYQQLKFYRGELA